MLLVLFIAAILPVVALCYFIYAKDVNREPGALLAKVFAGGFFCAIPVIFVEFVLQVFFKVDGVTDIFIIFINVFIGIALVEELFKWVITRFIAYSDKAFDEVYDIIVYSVFASLGFACIENILYVVNYGLDVAFRRAIFAIPGHMCFGVIMGYFLAQAKLGESNGNKSLAIKNTIFSILAPTLAHTVYDSLLYATTYINDVFYAIFLVFHIVMVVLCFIVVAKMSKMQQKINQNLQTGVIKIDNIGYIQYSGSQVEPNYCPICGQPAKGFNYCNSCGFKLK